MLLSDVLLISHKVVLPTFASISMIRGQKKSSLELLP